MKTIRIWDDTAHTEIELDGADITVIDSGGCPVESILGGKLDSATVTTDQVRAIWGEGYDGDTDAIRVEITEEAAQ